MHTIFLGFLPFACIDGERWKGEKLYEIVKDAILWMFRKDIQKEWNQGDSFPLHTSLFPSNWQGSGWLGGVDGTTYEIIFFAIHPKI